MRAAEEEEEVGATLDDVDEMGGEKDEEKDGANERAVAACVRE